MPFGDESETRKSGLRSPPSKGVRQVLRSDGVKQFGCGRNSQVEHFPKKRPRDAQAFGNVAGSIKLRIHDQTLPPDRSARFFEINAHDHKQAVSQFLRQLGKTFGIFTTGFQIVNGTRAHNGQKTLVFPVNEGVHFISRLRNEHLLLGRAGDIAAQIGR